MGYWALAAIGWVASAAACAAIARAKGKSVGIYALLGLVLGVLGVLIAAVQQPEAVKQEDGEWRRAGRWDWMLGGGPADASLPAILFSVIAVGFTVWFAIQAANGSYNTLDSGRVEAAIEANLAANGVTGASVDCPSSMSGRPGSVSFCDVTSDAGQNSARVTVENSAGDITWTII